MLIGILRIFAIVCSAIICGKLISKLKLPAILGWLITGIILGPYLAEVVTLDITNALWYKILIKLFECFAGVMIGREIIFKKLASSGKQIIGITFVQSIGTFLVVSFVFALVFMVTGTPIYLAFVFGGIALATAPAPALSIVNEYHTNGPVTKTLIPLAAIDDVIGVIVFFTVISIISGVNSGAQTSVLSIVGIVLLPFVVGILMGLFASFLMKRIHHRYLRLLTMLLFLCLSTFSGLLIDFYIYNSFRLNYLLIGMAFSATIAKAEPTVTKYLGFTLLPHSGVSLVFTGIAVTTLTSIDVSLASIVSGTIVAAAIINEIIAVIVAKFAFKWAGEISE
ncbi:MAG: cation:proton antiporter [Lachnospiraceae bacterium]|nr:cation:proton antiporter [Lachnospiraceae bacterium]